MTGRGGRRRRVVAGALVVVVGLAAGAWLVGTRVQSPSQAARAAAPVPSWITAPVERRVLSSTVIARGNVAPAVTTAVGGPSLASASDGGGGAAVVTGVFVARGDEVDAGDRIVEVAGRPVFVFEGQTPMYRALRPGMTGADVAQLQTGLAGLGCDAGDSRTYDDATKVCVEQLYTNAGYETARGSATELADLAAAGEALDTAADHVATAEIALAAASEAAPPGDVADAEAAVAEAQRAHDTAIRSRSGQIDAAVGELDAALTTLNAELVSAGTAEPEGAEPAADGGATAGGASVAGRRDAWTAVVAAVGGVDDAHLGADDEVATTARALESAQRALDAVTAPADVTAEQLAVDQAVAARERAERALADLEAVSGAIVPLGEVVFVPELPARVDSVDAAIGAAASGGDPDGGGGQALVVVGSPVLHASVDLPQSARALVQERGEVELLLEATGETVTGKVAAIGDELEQSGTSGLPSYVAVIEAELPESWSGRNVRATFTAATTEDEVLVVPEAAVTSAADGQTRVQVEADDGSLTTVDVTAGLAADGFVEVEPVGAQSLEEGDRVVIGR